MGICSSTPSFLHSPSKINADAIRGENLLSTSLSPKKSPNYYKSQGNAYFDFISQGFKTKHIPYYSNHLIRWEWKPWLLLTAKNSGMNEWLDLDGSQHFFLPVEVPYEERYVRFYPENPYCRMIVRMYCPTKEENPKPLWIYEEFTFTEDGDISFIEAWSYPEKNLLNGLGEEWGGYIQENPEDPVVKEDQYVPSSSSSSSLSIDTTLSIYWPRMDTLYRLSTRIPGLGSSTGIPRIYQYNQITNERDVLPIMNDALENEKTGYLKHFVDKYIQLFPVQYAQEYTEALGDEIRMGYLDELVVKLSLPPLSQ